MLHEDVFLMIFLPPYIKILQPVKVQVILGAHPIFQNNANGSTIITQNEGVRILPMSLL